jgi:hypothetical protein
LASAAATSRDVTRPSDDRALGEEVVPRLDAEALEIESGNSRSGDSRPRGFTGPRSTGAQHESRCGENGRAHRARGDGCTGDVVRRQRTGAAAQRPAGFAGKKRVELPLTHASCTIIDSWCETTFAPVMWPLRSTPAMTSNGTVE